MYNLPFSALSVIKTENADISLVFWDFCAGSDPRGLWRRGEDKHIYSIH